MQKDKDTDKANLFLVVIPEKYEPIIFNTYHDSLLAGHQGPYHTAMTIRQKFFIHNLMNKVKRYIEACHTCLKSKPKYMKNRPTYRRLCPYATFINRHRNDATSVWRIPSITSHHMRSNKFYYSRTA